MPAIRPNDLDLVPRKAALMPEAVFEAFNDLIASGWDGYQSRVLQNEVADLITKKRQLEGIAAVREDVFSNNWLDIEPIYRAAGWEVTYDKPGYNEKYGAFFIFRKGGKS